MISTYGRLWRSMVHLVLNHVRRRYGRWWKDFQRTERQTALVCDPHWVGRVDCAGSSGSSDPPIDPRVMIQPLAERLGGRAAAVTLVVERYQKDERAFLISITPRGRQQTT